MNEIEKIESLKNLEIDFSDNELFDGAITEISAVLKKLSMKIESIVFRFLQTAISNQSYKLMYDELSRLANLKFYMNSILSEQQIKLYELEK